jgi:predicted hydrocarbon binding protein
LRYSDGKEQRRNVVIKRENLIGAAQVKGTMIQAHLNWLRKQGHDPTTALASHLAPEVAKLVAHSVLATSWVSLSALIAVDRAIAAVARGGSDEVFRELGRYSATSNLSGIYAGFVSEEPHRFFEKQARLHDRFQSFGASAYKPLGPRAGQMRLTNYTEYSPVFCLSAIGYYQGALETMKAPGPIRVRETACTCAGDEACVFDLSW